jgi:lysophospholipase
VQEDAIARNPKLAVGGVTYGWLGATFDSIDAIHRRGFAESIRVPVWMVSAGADRIVSAAAQRRFCRRMPGCRLTIIPDALHEVLMEQERIRNRFWRGFDRFLERVLR